MGALVNPRWLTALAGVLAAMIIALNVFLLQRSSSAERAVRFGDEPGRGLSSRCLDALPPDWTDLELDLRIDDESRYIDAAVALSQVNAQPYSQAEWHWRLSSPTASATPPRRRRSTGVLAKLDARGHRAASWWSREVREGRSEVVQMWGRPESVREEFRQRRSI